MSAPYFAHFAGSKVRLCSYLVLLNKLGAVVGLLCNTTFLGRGSSQKIFVLQNWWPIRAFGFCCVTTGLVDERRVQFEDTQCSCPVDAYHPKSSSLEKRAIVAHRYGQRLCGTTTRPLTVACSHSLLADTERRTVAKVVADWLSACVNSRACL